MADNVPLGMEFMRWQNNPGLFDKGSAYRKQKNQQWMDDCDLISLS